MASDIDWKREYDRISGQLSFLQDAIDPDEAELPFGDRRWNDKARTMRMELCALREENRRLRARLRAIEGDGTPMVNCDANLFTSDSGGAG